MSGSLLIPEPPLQVLPSLAKAIGLNEAIVLQQLYWLLKDERNGTLHDGRRWVYNTIPQWRQNFFPFWSEDTIMRTFQNLEGMFLIDTCQPEGWQSRRKYYCLNEGGISKLTTENFSDSSDNRKLSVSDGPITANCQLPITANCQLPHTNKEDNKRTPLPPQAGGLGSATVVTTVNGRGTVPRVPSTPEAKRIAVLLRRRETTGWSPKEVRAFRNLEKIEPEDLDAVEKYYLSESQKKQNYCRRDLYTFLNNFRGEVDRARNWLEKGRKKEERESIL